MKATRTTPWSRLRVLLATLLVLLFILGGLIAYASSLPELQAGRRRADLFALGVGLMALSVLCGIFSFVLAKRLLHD
jgi:hypothetical protein